MKTAIYIEDGYTQVVLTPENEFEKSIVNKASGPENKLVVKRAGFTRTVGRYVRRSDDEDSLMIIIARPPEPGENTGGQ